MESSRRKQAQERVGIINNREEVMMTNALQKEEERRNAKELWRNEIEESSTYRLLKGIAKIMDRYFLDPILGFIPVIGDFVTSVFSLPFIYVSLVKIKSIPLTLAIIYNVMIDTFVGMIPFFIGDLLDAFVRCHLKNLRLIVGFVEDDKEIIKEVNRKAVFSALGILLFFGLIYLLLKLVASLLSWIGSLF